MQIEVFCCPGEPKQILLKGRYFVCRYNEDKDVLFCRNSIINNIINIINIIK